MRITKRAVARWTIAVMMGVAAAILTDAYERRVLQYRWNYEHDNIWDGWSGWWSDYLELSTVWATPIAIIASIVALVSFHFILRPKSNVECRCRRCGYILKGLSKPECPECGEVI